MSDHEIQLWPLPRSAWIYLCMLVGFTAVLVGILRQEAITVITGWGLILFSRISVLEKRLSHE